MKNNSLLAVLVIATTVLAACNRGGGSGAELRTTSQIAAAEIATNTVDNAEPILLNDLPISDADTDETAKPVPVI